MKSLLSLIRRPTALAGLLVILSLALSACSPAAAGAAPAGAYGVTYPSATPPPAPTQTVVVPVTGATSAAPTATTAAPAASGASVQVVNNPKLGQILVGSNGMTLYTFALDSSGVSKCAADCLAYWPVYSVSGALSADASLKAQLGTFTRADGVVQVTYNGMPLYNYILDSNPGDVLGDGVNDFGGIWHVVAIGAASNPYVSGSYQ